MEERRSFIRFPATVQLSFSNDTGEIQKDGVTHDISANGVGCYTTENYSSDTPLEIWLKVPDQEKFIYIKGEVIWSHMVNPNLYRTGINLQMVDFVSIAYVLRMSQSH